MKSGTKQAAHLDFTPSQKPSHATCIECGLAKVDWPKSKTLCLWCRLGHVAEGICRACCDHRHPQCAGDGCRCQHKSIDAL